MTNDQWLMTNDQIPTVNGHPPGFPRRPGEEVGLGHFDASRAVKHAQAIARPRLVGTPGEAFAADYITHAFRTAGLEVTEEPFEFSAGWENIQRGFLLLIIGLLSVAYWVRSVYPGMTAVLGLIVVVSLLAYNPASHRIFARCPFPEGGSPDWLARLVLRTGPRLRSRNLVARLPLAGKPDSPAVYLVAHYDSKSQNMTLVQRVRLVMILALGGLAFGAISLAAGLQPELIHNTWLGGLYATVYILSTLAALLLLTLRTGNRSPGAIDNAIGVGTLLHLAELLAQDQALAQKLDVTFVATGAEEWGLMGAFAFVKTHREALVDRARRNGLYVLNLDGPGVNGPVYATASVGPGARHSSPLLGIIEAAGRDCGVDVRVANSIVGLMADHFPFVLTGLDAVTLATAGPASWSVHSPRDTIEQLDPVGVERVGQVVGEVLYRLRTNFGL